MSTPGQEAALVKMLATEMRVKLAVNSSRPHWKDGEDSFYLQRLDEELGEFVEALRGDDALAVLSEAADVANFIAMIVWRRLGEKK